jgi:hypothetical protein
MNRRKVAALYRSLTILKPIFGVAATGVVALLLWKVLAAFLLPLIGIAVGFFFLVAKLVFWGVMICVAIWLFRRLSRREEKLA